MQSAYGVPEGRQKEEKVVVNAHDGRDHNRAKPSLSAVWSRLKVAVTTALATALPGELGSSFVRFAGRWTAEKAVAFNELTQRTVDEEDWK